MWDLFARQHRDLRSSFSHAPRRVSNLECPLSNLGKRDALSIMLRWIYVRAVMKQLQQELQTALQQDSMTLMFQPVMNAHSELVSAEVLTRWYRADGEFIPPAEFVALMNRVE